MNILLQVFVNFVQVCFSGHKKTSIVFTKGAYISRVKNDGRHGESRGFVSNDVYVSFPSSCGLTRTCWYIKVSYSHYFFRERIKESALGIPERHLKSSSKVRMYRKIVR